MGTLLSRQVEAMSPKAQALFTPGDRARLFRLAGWAAGSRWIESWMPRRWDLNYAHGLGYRVKFTPSRLVPRPWEDNLPYYQSGVMVQAAMGARPVVSSAKGRVKIAVVVPIGHPLRPDLAKAFKTVPAMEAMDVADAFRDAVVSILESGTTTITRGRGKGRLSLSAALRAQAKTIQGRKATAGMSAVGSAQLRGIAMGMQGERAAFNAKRLRKSGTYSDWMESVRLDPNRAKHIRASGAARQQRFRARQRLKRAGLTTSN
jgi:hypothetical protein